MVKLLALSILCYKNEFALLCQMEVRGGYSASFSVKKSAPTVCEYRSNIMLSPRKILVARRLFLLRLNFLLYHYCTILVWNCIVLYGDLSYPKTQKSLTYRHIEKDMEFHRIIEISCRAPIPNFIKRKSSLLFFAKYCSTPRKKVQGRRAKRRAVVHNVIYSSSYHKAGVLCKLFAQDWTCAAGSATMEQKEVLK